MNTKQAEYRTEIARLAQKLAESDALASKRDARAASERTVHTRWLIGAIAIATLIIIGSPNILLR